jgi:hypothetical protein
MRALAVAVLLALALTPACSRKPADPVAALLAELEAAAEARDTGRFGERLSPDFRGSNGLDRPGAIELLRRHFAAYESVGLEVYGVETDRDAASARVRCVVEFSGKARQAFGLSGLLPPSAVYRFELDAAEEGGVWRVRGATWTPAEPEESRP